MNLSNEQYNQILRDYDDRRLKNHQELMKRQEEVYEKIPELAQIDREIASGSVAYARRMLFSGFEAENRHAADKESLQERNRKLANRKRYLLVKAGYPKDYLQSHFQCPNCQDTGFVEGKKCHCLQQAIINVLYHQSNLRDMWKKDIFNNFLLDYYDDKKDPVSGLIPRETARAAYMNCLNFAKDFDKSYTNLLLYGNTGVGKTFLSHCIANALLVRSHTVIYLTAFELFDAMEKSTFRLKEEDNSEPMLDYILNCDLLIIDDLGTEMSNTFTNSRLYLCLNERILHQKPTVISTNLSLDVLQQTYSERILSRLSSEYTTIRMIGEDIRLRKSVEKIP